MRGEKRERKKRREKQIKKRKSGIWAAAPSDLLTLSKGDDTARGQQSFVCGHGASQHPNPLCPARTQNKRRSEKGRNGIKIQKKLCFFMFLKSAKRKLKRDRTQKKKK